MPGTSKARALQQSLIVRRALCLVLALCGCKIDILGDPEPDPCPMSELDYCVPSGIAVRVFDVYSGAAPEPTLARGGLVELVVDDGGHDEDLDVEVSGGAVVSSDGRHRIVRALEETVTIRAAIGNFEDELVLTSQPVERVRLIPMERPFQLATDPVEFAIARGARVLVAVRLEASSSQLIDSSLVATGDQVADQRMWDLVEIDAAADRIEIALEAESGDAAVEIASAEPALDAIEVIAGPGLADPTQPIELSADGGAMICFFGLADGLPLAGLEWVVEGSGTSGSDGCVTLNQFASSFTVSAGGLTRTFEVDLVEPDAGG